MLVPRLLAHQTSEAMHVQGNDGQSNRSGKSLRTFRPNTVEATVFKIGNCSPPIQAPETPQQFQIQLLCQDSSFAFGYDDLRRQILILSLRLRLLCKRCAEWLNHERHDGLTYRVDCG